MTTNKTIELQRECCPSTIRLGFQSLIKNEVAMGSPDYFLLKVSAKPERLSSHGRKRSLSNVLREREQNDVSFKARMIEARKLLADEIEDVLPEDSLTTRRLKKGLSQQGLANILGTSQSHVAKIEAGKVDIYFDTATKIADALQITLDDLRKLVKMSKHPELIIVAS